MTTGDWYADEAVEMTKEDFDRILSYLRKHLRMEPYTRKHLLYGEWITSESEQDRRMMEIAREYVEKTDAYDARVCTGTRHGEPFPLTAQEHGLINRNARQVANNLVAKYHITEKQLHDAIQRYYKRRGI